jgi:hypothetical protein
MGAWGVGLFSDDTALDVRDGYRDLVGDGLSGPEATDALLGEWGGTVDDPDDGPAFWLALAKTQWQCGRLEDRVKEKALEVIDNGADLRRWDGTPLVKKRSAVLERLREQIVAPQPREKRVPKRFVDTCDWQLGEVVCYRLLSGDLLLLHVVDYHVDKGGTSPVVEILNHVGPALPSARRMKRLGVMESPRGKRHFILGREKESELPLDRIERPGVSFKPTSTSRGATLFLWRWLDRALEEELGVR